MSISFLPKASVTISMIISEQNTKKNHGFCGYYYLDENYSMTVFFVCLLWGVNDKCFDACDVKSKSLESPTEIALWKEFCLFDATLSLFWVIWIRSLTVNARDDKHNDLVMKRNTLQLFYFDSHSPRWYFSLRRIPRRANMIFPSIL